MYPAGTNVSDAETLVPQWIAGCKNIEKGQDSAVANVSDRIDKKHAAIYQLCRMKKCGLRSFILPEKQLRLCPSKVGDRA